MSYARYVAIGDSQTEGLLDGDEISGYRGWADRLAGQLAAASPGLLYANLAVRGRLAAQVRDAQLGPALELRPDLATVTFYGFPEGPGGPVAGRAPRPIDIASLFQGPILSFWGDQDNIPMELVDRFGAEAARHGADYRYQVYPGAGHGFLQGLVEERADSESAQDAWKQTLAFLDGALTLP